MKKFQFLLTYLWIILLSGFITGQDEEPTGYIFTCPRSLKTGAPNELRLQRFGNLEAGNLRVQVFAQENYNGNESLVFEENYVIEQGERDSFLNLTIKPFQEFVYNGRLAINGTFSDYNIGGSDKVYFSPSGDTIVVIQTDKPIYKEGDTVKFRILRVNKDLKPIGADIVTIRIEDPKGIILNQWTLDSFDGLTQLQYLLANEPALGYWRITADFMEDQTYSQIFEVAEYRLPQYEVIVYIPPFVLANAEEIPITVCAKYTYGKPVKGDIRMNISLEMFTWSFEKLPVQEYDGQIDGCLSYTINVSLIDIGNYNSYRRIQISVSVAEFGTGIQMNTIQFIQREYTPLYLNFQGQLQFFKPGLPYNGKLSVTNPDNTPAEDEPIEICFTATRERVVYNWQARRIVKFCKNFTSDEDGNIEFIMLPQNTDATGITLEAKSLKYAPDPTGTFQQNSLSQPQASLYISPWYSPSRSFIQLQPVSETLLCGSERNIRVLFTSQAAANFTFYFQVSSQGKTLYTGTVETSFEPSENVYDEFRDEDKLINDQETVLLPENVTSSSEEEDCPSARETPYVPFVGDVYLNIPIEIRPSPNLHVLVHCTRDDRETMADSQRITVENCLKNQVTLKFSDEEVQPGTTTNLTITSSPNSLCGIKVVDKGVSLLNSNEQITKEKIFNMLEELDSGVYFGDNYCGNGGQPGLNRAIAPNSIILPPFPQPSSSYVDSLAAFQNAGILVISDFVLVTRPCGTTQIYPLPIFNSAVAKGGGAVAFQSTTNLPDSNGNIVTATVSASDIRTEFPETWLFELEMTGPEGEFSKVVQLPDTITEWDGDAFCINDEDGLGIANKTSIRGFQAFFISLTLPYSVIRGELLWISVSIFNYINDSLPITVTIEGIEGFEIIGESIDDDVCVQPETSVVLKFQLNFTALGEQNITVRAETAANSNACGNISVSDAYARDAIRQSLIVEAEGYPREEVESTLICLDGEGNNGFEKQYFFNTSDDVVNDSARVIVDVTGNVLGKSINNLENLVTLPTGCGEQNMVKFAPNVVVIKFFNKTNQLTEELKNRIEGNLKTGYQNQLQYLRPDGSFSAFGFRDEEGSMFLTAFVLRYFAGASKYIPIDPSLLVQMQNWIISHQQTDGCFPDIGKIFDRGIQGGIKSICTTTAYVLASLLISNYSDQTELDQALSCVLSCTEEDDDESFYLTFLSAYAEALAGDKESAKSKIDEARQRAITKDGIECYHDVNGTKSQDIETAAYSILSSLKSGDDASSLLPIVQCLVQNINPYGGFISTQDTCVALDALSEFAALTFDDELNMNISITGALEKFIEIKELDRLEVKRFTISEVPSGIQVEARGSGCVVFQTVFRYNSKTSPERRYFEIKVEGNCNDENCIQRSLTITVRYLPEGKKTGMALVEVKMVSGTVPDEASLDELQNENSNIMRYDVENNKVMFYFNELSNRPEIMEFVVTQIIPVENPQPGEVKVYDYYDTTIFDIAPYTFDDESKDETVAE